MTAGFVPTKKNVCFWSHTDADGLVWPEAVTKVSEHRNEALFFYSNVQYNFSINTTITQQYKFIYPLKALKFCNVNKEIKKIDFLFLSSDLEQKPFANVISGCLAIVQTLT